MRRTETAGSGSNAGGREQLPIRRTDGEDDEDLASLPSMAVI